MNNTSSIKMFLDAYELDEKLHELWVEHLHNGGGKSQLIEQMTKQVDAAFAAAREQQAKEEAEAEAEEASRPLPPFPTLT